MNREQLIEKTEKQLMLPKPGAVKIVENALGRFAHMYVPELGWVMAPMALDLETVRKLEQGGMRAGKLYSMVSDV
jgi:hypothetical protein